MVSFSRSSRSVRRGARPADVSSGRKISHSPPSGSPTRSRRRSCSASHCPTDTVWLGARRCASAPQVRTTRSPAFSRNCSRVSQGRSGTRGAGDGDAAGSAAAGAGALSVPAGSRHAIAQLLDPEHELARIDRLRDVVVGADPQPGQPIVDGAAAGEEHQRDAGRVGVRLELPRGREAVLVGHLHVEQDHRRTRGLGARDHLGAAGDDRDLEAGPMQEPRDQEMLILVVVGDEHGLPRLDRRDDRRRLGADAGALLVERAPDLAEEAAGRRLVEARRRIGRGESFERGRVLRELGELGGAGAADQAMGRLRQLEHGVGVALSCRLDEDRQHLEAAREGGDEPPPAFVDDLADLVGRQR